MVFHLLGFLAFRPLAEDTGRATDGSNLKLEFSESFMMLPNLENLDIVYALVPLALLSSFIAARWNAPRWTLKSVTLWGCISDTGEELPSYAPGDDPTFLPAELDDVKQFIAQGLVLRIGGSATGI